MAHQFIEIPKGTKESRHTSCGAAVYWVEQKRAGGKVGTARIMVDTDVSGGSEPDSLSVGRGVNHLFICTEEG